MDFKFIVLALVISAATGDDTASRKFSSSVALTNKSLSLDTIKHSDVASPTEKVASQVSNDDGTKINKNSKVVSPDETTSENNTTTSTTAPPPPPTSTTSTSSTTSTTTTTTTLSTPVPTPEEGQWKVENGTRVCIVVQMELQFNVTYPGTKNSVQNGTIYVPKNAVASGICSNMSQSIQLKWGQNNSFQIAFGLNKTSNKFEVRLLNLTISCKDFKDVAENSSFMSYVSSKTEFPAVPVKMSYKCDKEQVLVLNSTTTNYSAKMLVSHTQLEAFMRKKNATFSEAQDCEGFETPGIVPIAVGCILSILVITVLIAYFIARRRSQNRGYLSM